MRPQLKTLLETVDGIQEVTSYPKIKFTGYPSAYVVPVSNTGAYESTTENVRVYTFMVRIFHETGKKTIEESLNTLDDLVDSVIDLFDKESVAVIADRTIGIGLPSQYTFLNIFAVPGNWGQLPNEKLIMAEVVVKIRLSVDITLLA